MVEGLKVTGDKKAAAGQIKALYKLFVDSDCTMVEVNPLAEGMDGTLIAADAKMGFDDNAAYRQKEIFAMRDECVSGFAWGPAAGLRWGLGGLGGGRRRRRSAAQRSLSPPSDPLLPPPHPTPLSSSLLLPTTQHTQHPNATGPRSTRARWRPPAST